MRIIPVIDIKQGIVVHAIEGNRTEYQPIQSELINSSDPSETCHYFCSKLNTKLIYIADLDAIMDGTHQHELIETLLRANADLNIWLDSGSCFFSHQNALHKRVTQVIGTEIQFSPEQLQEFHSMNIALSLDFDKQGLVGDIDLLNYPEFWPEQIIVMNLDRVGSKKGIEISRIESIQQKLLPEQKLYIAGGIRDQSDLNKVESLGIAGVLVASALHDKSISLA